MEHIIISSKIVRYKKNTRFFATHPNNIINKTFTFVQINGSQLF